MLEQHTDSSVFPPNGHTAPVFERIARGQIDPAADIIALRRVVGLTQKQFASAIGISVHTLRNWEQGRRTPDGPALALLRIAARHPQIIRENLGGSDAESAAPSLHG